MVQQIIKETLRSNISTANNYDQSHKVTTFWSIYGYKQP